MAIDFNARLRVVSGRKRVIEQTFPIQETDKDYLERVLAGIRNMATLLEVNERVAEFSVTITRRK